jgi:hypothetical protein
VRSLGTDSVRVPACAAQAHARPRGRRAGSSTVTEPEHGCFDLAPAGPHTMRSRTHPEPALWSRRGSLGATRRMCTGTACRFPRPIRASGSARRREQQRESDRGGGSPRPLALGGSSCARTHNSPQGLATTSIAVAYQPTVTGMIAFPHTRGASGRMRRALRQAAVRPPHSKSVGRRPAAGRARRDMSDRPQRRRRSRARPQAGSWAVRKW